MMKKKRKEKLSRWPAGLIVGYVGLPSPFSFPGLYSLHEFPNLPELPRINQIQIRENYGRLVASLELPGVDEDDLTIDITENRVTVRTSHTEKNENPATEDYSYSHESSENSRALPYAVDIDNVSHKYDGRVLEIKLVKKE